MTAREWRREMPIILPTSTMDNLIGSSAIIVQDTDALSVMIRVDGPEAYILAELLAVTEPLALEIRPLPNLNRRDTHQARQ